LVETRRRLGLARRRRRRRPRHLLRRAPFAAVLAAPLHCGAAPPNRLADVAALSSDDFYAAFPYAKAGDVVPFVRATAAAGDAAQVLRAMELFGERYPMYAIGSVKGRIVDHVLQSRKCTLCCEVGSFLGYSAVRIAAQLPPAGRLICCEASEEFAAVAMQNVAYAGLSGKVDFVIGRASDKMDDISRVVGSRLDFLFLDHAKEAYSPDLARFEARGLVGPGTVVVADNVVYPGAPGYLEYVTEPNYATTLAAAPYESKGWETKWQDQEDAMSISIRR